MIWKLALLFTIVPALELFLLIRIGMWMGPLETVLLILLTGVVGAALAKREGLAVVTQLREDVSRGIPPASRIVEGVLVLIGGILLITPGVLSDAAGILFIFPLSRRLLAPVVLRAVASRFQIQGVNLGPEAADPRAAAPRTPASERGGTPFDHPVR